MQNACTRRFSFHSLYLHRANTPSASDTRRFSLPNYWAFFGGGIEQGESPTEALEREVLEELSYQVQKPYFLMAQKVRDGEDENTKYVFVEQYQDQPLQLGEGQAMGWFFPDETHKLKMIEHDRAIVERMREYLSHL